MTNQALIAQKTKVKGLRAPASQMPWKNRIVGSGEEPPDQLLANPSNWRIHPANQKAALAGSLDSVGWVQQVLVNRRSGFVVDGHARVALAAARHEAVPVLYIDLDPEEEALVLATLDPIGALAGADKRKLEELLRELTPADDALQSMLNDLADKNGIRRPGFTEPDDLPPEPEPEDVYVKPGERWLLGDHRLLCGDATSPNDVARLLDGATPTLLATDPPYGVSLDGSWRDAAGYNALGPAEKPYMRIAGQSEKNDATRAPSGAHMRTAGHRNTSLSGDTRVDWSEAFALVPSLRVGYVWHAGVHAREVAEGLERIGFQIVSQVVWDKGLFAMGRSWYHWAHEPCWVVRAVGAKVPFYGERNQATLWRVPSPKMIMAGSKEEKFDHPAQKPVILSETPIRNHLKAGEAVYDPFLGSGTTLIAAERLGRVCYAMELDPRYAQIAITRWKAFTGRKAVLDG